MSAGQPPAPRRTGTHALIVGLGVSGAAAARALLRRGAAVTVVDAAEGGALEERASTLRQAGAQVRLGRATATDVAGVDLVVASPGVPQGGAVLSEARRRRLPLWSEPELAWRLAAGRTRLLAVSGTNGKTTTTELLAGCLGAPAAGNIGTPLVELLAADVPPPLVVAELSSFQLRFTATLRADVAVLLNVAADHLDWHGSLDAYRAAKARVWANQRRGDWAVLNADDGGARAVAAAHPPAARTVDFTLAAPRRGQVGVDAGAVVAFLGDAPVEVVAVDALGVSGTHNVANVCAAVAAALAAGGDAAALAGPLAAYRPGGHRLERVALLDGVCYVDDSKATNPHAAAAALASFPRRSVVWIAGGLAKGLTFEALRGEIGRRVRSAATIGTSGPEIARLVRGLGIDVVEAGTLPAAVVAAAAAARPGDTVLLAPACASMDQFRDYAERGRVFRDAVAALAGGRPQPVAKEAAGGH